MMSEGYKTEEQLKQEALARKKREREIAALRPQKTDGQKKRENYWYHYKWHTVCAAVALVLIIWFVSDVVFRVDPDITVIAMSEAFLSDECMAAIESLVGEAGGDYNGDGKTVVSINFTPAITQGGELDYTSSMKITTFVAASVDPVYLLDGEAYRILLGMTGESMFEEFSVPADIPGANGLTFYIRKKDAYEKNADYYEYCENMMKNIN